MIVPGNALLQIFIRSMNISEVSKCHLLQQMGAQ